MSSMYIALGYNCNHKCFFCPCGNNKVKAPVASLDALKKAVDNGAVLGVNHITLSGGEPTLYPHFNEILNYCISHSMCVGILSNGDTFSNQNKLEIFFKDTDIRKVHVTTAIHSITPELHEKVTRSKGSFERTVKGIGNLIRHGINVTVKQVISKWNYMELPDFVDFVFREYGPFVSLTLCGMDFCGMESEQIDAVAVDFITIKPYLEQALDKIINIRMKYNAFPHVSVADIPLCCADPYYWGFFMKVSRGELKQYSAPISENGDVKSQNNVVNDCDIFFEECRKCCVADRCPGVWKTAYEYFGESAVKCVLPYKPCYT